MARLTRRPLTALLLLTSVVTALAAQAPAVGSSVAFVQWVEPTERSFAVEVPAGWTVTGGVSWTGPLDPQPFVRAESADGKVHIVIGDADLLPRQVPTTGPAGQSGPSEGDPIRSPTGGRLLVQPFQTSGEFARQQIAIRHCPTPRVVSETDLPVEAARIAIALAPETRKWKTDFTVSAGEVGFLCDATQGYLSAITILESSRSGSVSTWFVQTVGVLLSADPMRSMQARLILEHMMATMTRDQAWQQGLEERVRAATGIGISMQNAAIQAQLAADERAATTLSRLTQPEPGPTGQPGERRATSANPTLDMKDVCDALGRCRSVPNEAKGLFMDHYGNVRPGRPEGGPPDNSGTWSPTFVR